MGSVQKREESEKLMVKHFLDLCAELTTKSYAYDGFLKNGKILKGEMHNIKSVLRMCSNLNDSEISKVLTKSEIYQSSCRFFYNIVKHIVSETVLETFLKACLDLAKKNEEWANYTNFFCILVDKEGRKSLTWKSDAYFEKMGEAEKLFRMYDKYLANDVALQAYYYFQHGRYCVNQFKFKEYNDGVRWSTKANENLCLSLNIRKNLPESNLAKADVILSLIQLGNLWKAISGKQYAQKDPTATKDSEKSLTEAKKYYEEAMKQAQENLGKHELTSTCHKLLGDLILQSRQNEKALKCYEVAQSMRDELNLDATEAYMLLLKNIGRCLTYLCRYEEAIQKLEEARCIQENLTGKDEPNARQGRLYASLALAYKKSKINLEKAREFAEKSLKINEEMNREIIRGYEFNNLLEIVGRD